MATRLKRRFFRLLLSVLPLIVIVHVNVFSLRVWRLRLLGWRLYWRLHRVNIALFIIRLLTL